MKQTITVHAAKHTENFDIGLLAKLPGNRSVSKQRVMKIERSVDKVGWIIPTIVVNEKLEVIDGQGRVEVAKRYNLPINVDVIPGLGIADCVAMNVEQTNWAMTDFIESYAEQGVPDYIRFRDLLHENKHASIQVAFMAATGKPSLDTEGIKNGTMEFGELAFAEAKESLKWLRPYMAVMRDEKVKAPAIMSSALIYAWGHRDAIDLERMQRAFEGHRFTERDTFADIHDALRFLDDIYNNRLKKTPRIFLEHWYVEDMAQSSTPYMSRIKNGTYKFHTTVKVGSK